MIITIDGPSGAGKSTVAKELSKRLNYTFVETGAFYRAVAFMALLQNIELGDEGAVCNIAKNIKISFKFENDTNNVFIGKQEVTNILRTPKIAFGASAVSKLPKVREALLETQRDFANNGNVVLEGRDTGTVVCPWAEIKIYLDADLRIRAKRQYNALMFAIPKSFEDFVKEVQQRDEQDMNREHSPLKAADDAVVVDTSLLKASDTVDRVLDIVKEKSNEQ